MANPPAPPWPATPLVDAEALAGALGDPSVVVADVRWYLDGRSGAEGPLEAGPAAARPAVAREPRPWPPVLDAATVESARADPRTVLLDARAGLPGARLYPGSWSDWCADPARPVALGHPAGGE